MILFQSVLIAFSLHSHRLCEALPYATVVRATEMLHFVLQESKLTYQNNLIHGIFDALHERHNGSARDDDFDAAVK